MTIAICRDLTHTDPDGAATTPPRDRGGWVGAPDGKSWRRPSGGGEVSAGGRGGRGPRLARPVVEGVRERQAGGACGTGGDRSLAWPGRTEEGITSLPLMVRI